MDDGTDGVQLEELQPNHAGGTQDDEGDLERLRGKPVNPLFFQRPYFGPTKKDQELIVPRLKAFSTQSKYLSTNLKVPDRPFYNL